LKKQKEVSFFCPLFFLRDFSKKINFSGEMIVKDTNACVVDQVDASRLSQKAKMVHGG
jgi:hypothetical protein